ncbi:uncharacterized protein LOC144436826 [Glandiceps talaboti]
MATTANPEGSSTATTTAESFPPGVASLVTSITGSITTVVESKLAQFKRELSLDTSEAIDSAAKKARGDTYEFQKPGNKQQFEHQEKVLDSLETALDAVTKGAIEKAKKSLKQDIFQVEDWKSELNNPALRNLCETIPDVMLASKAGTTVSKYTNGWIRWKEWCSVNLSADAAFPAKPVHIAVYLRSLLDGAKTAAPLETAIQHQMMMAGIQKFVGDISKFGTHSFRAGGATVAANSNVNERCLARHGGWKSTSSKDRYIVDSLSMKLDVARSLGV